MSFHGYRSLFPGSLDRQRRLLARGTARHRRLRLHGIAGVTLPPHGGGPTSSPGAGGATSHRRCPPRVLGRGQPQQGSRFPTLELMSSATVVSRGAGALSNGLCIIVLKTETLSLKMGPPMARASRGYSPTESTSSSQSPTATASSCTACTALPAPPPTTRPFASFV